MEPPFFARVGVVIYFVTFGGACEREVEQVGEPPSVYEGRGSVVVSRTRDGEASARAIYRQSADDPTSACTFARSGDCELSDCPAALVSNDGVVSAGAIEIAGASRDVRLEPLGTGYAQSTATSWNFEPGAELFFFVAGAGAVPAHRASIEAPSAIALSAPGADATLRRDIDLEVKWDTGTTGEKLRFTLGETVDAGTQPRAVDIRCSAPADRGALVVPRDLLARLEPSGDARWDPLESTCRHASLSIL